MSSLTKTANTKIEISSGEPATHDKAGFDAKTYTQIKGIKTISEHGVTIEIQSYQSIDDEYEQRYESAKKTGDIDIAMARNEADPGQAILASSLGNGHQSLKITDSKGFIAYKLCLVGSYTTNYGGATDLKMASSKLALTKSPVAGQ